MVDCKCSEIIEDLLRVEEECSHFTGDIRHIEGLKELSVVTVYPEKRPGIECFRVPDSLTLIDHQEQDGIHSNYVDNTPEQIEQFFINNGYYDRVNSVTEEEPFVEFEINSDVYRRRCINLNWLFVDSFGWDCNLNILIDNFLGFARPFKLLRIRYGNAKTNWKSEDLVIYQ